ncbi:hypothetical protein EC988_003665, partial [Linderina pennispora]
MQYMNTEPRRPSGGFAPRGPRPAPPDMFGGPIVNTFGPGEGLDAPGADAQLDRRSSLSDRPVTAFVGNITGGVTDEWVEKVLGACGAVTSWKRVYDADGKPQKFGFCEFATPRDAMCALLVLGEEKCELPGTEPRKLAVTVDANMRRTLDMHRDRLVSIEAGSDSDQKTAVHAAKEAVEKVKEEMKDQALAEAGEGTEEIKGKQLTGQSTLEQASSSSDKKTRSKSATRSVSRARPTDHESISLEDEEAWEKQQAEAHRKRLYLDDVAERENRLARDEADRARHIEKLLLRDLDRIEERGRARDTMMMRFAAWDDDAEARMGDHEYYRDRERWWHHRKAVREREIELDVADRRQQRHEEERLAEEARKKQQQGQQQTPRRSSKAPEERNKAPAEKPAPKPIEKPAEKPVDPPAEKPAETPAEKPAETPAKKPDPRRTKIEQLIAEIPSEPDALFAWPIKWDHVDEEL